ncbi:MAG TPA: twin-arginine translocase TatA/TatE family subunit [Acidobacteriaceae bacterium]|jgi:sec-independent protein translocase protein TatB|nr:twin-arginine translocase TatA/TatE family subunit [Acidobacteriaceae bacterium]
MPGFGDYIFLFLLALILFGPKKMPELARQLGKLMAEFRKASNEFKIQMEEEMRASDRAEQEKKIAALAAAAPATTSETKAVPSETAPAIATSGELTMRPPETGVPAAAAAPSPADAVNALADSVPAATEATHG